MFTISHKILINFTINSNLGSNMFIKKGSDKEQLKEAIKCRTQSYTNSNFIINRRINEY